MTRRPVPIAAVAVVVCLASAALGALTAQLAAMWEVRRAARALAGAPGAAALATDIPAAVLFAFAILTPVLLAAALWLGWQLAGALERVRAEAVGLLREDTVPITHSSLAEIDAVAGAIDLLASELRWRVAASSRERTEIALLADAVGAGLLHLTPDGRIARMNAVARTLLNLEGVVAGQPIASVVRQPALRQALERASRGEAVDTAELALDTRQLLVAARPAARGGAEATGGPSAGLRGGAALILDLTELRRLEAVRRDFVASVSHELKTPLTSIRGYAETLLQDDLAPETRQEFLAVIQRNAERLHRIVDELLDLSRLESGGWQPAPEDLDPAELAAEAWASLQESGAAKRIAFATHATGSPRARADRMGLFQVFVNLFENSVRYTPDGGLIEVRLRARGGFLDLEVADSGTGIPRDHLPRIFERFYRVDPARSREQGGTGLGLAIVKHLVESMGGDVAAESELGKGTTIRLRLPAVLVEPSTVT